MKNSPTYPTRWHCVHLWSLDTQPPQVEPSFLGVKKERPAIAQPRQGIKQSASSRNSLTFAPTRIASEKDVSATDHYLCKWPWGDSHFCGHVSPMFCNMSPFFFRLARVNIICTWVSGFFFLWPLWLCLPRFTLPKLMLILFSMFSTTDFFFRTSLSSFRLNLM